MGNFGDILQNATTLGLIYGLMAIGLFISYRILDVADLTVDSSFTLGAATSAIFTINGKPLLGVFMAILAGMCAGLVTAFLQTKLKINPILAGILTMTGLYSINLWVMKKTPNLSLMRMKTIFTPLENLIGKKLAYFLVSLFFVVLVSVLILLFFKTHIGLAIRATGDNEDMVRSSSVNVDVMKMIALALANGIVALSGATLAQYQHSADIGMGTGIVIMGLASLVIGEVVVGRKHLAQNLIAVVVGSILYRIIFALVMELGISASDIKLMSAIIMILSISYPVIVQKVKYLRQKQLAKKIDITNICCSEEGGNGKYVGSDSNNQNI